MGRWPKKHQMGWEVAIASVALGLVVASCDDSGSSTDTSGFDDGGLGANASWSMIVENQVSLLSPCSGPSLTFFQGETRVDVASGATKQIDIPQLFGVYTIGFQVNGWYWRCAGGPNCPNLRQCQNPDNAGQVAIHVTPGATAPACATVELVKNYDQFTCDPSVPNASDVVTVTLEDPATCLVRVEASGLAMLDPSENCCDCSTCMSAPPGQQKYCR